MEEAEVDPDIEEAAADANVEEAAADTGIEVQVSGGSAPAFEREMSERDGLGGRGNELTGLRPLHARAGTRGRFFGRVQPCRVAKLESNFSLGQG
jgi:hypothetical protein